MIARLRSSQGHVYLVQPKFPISYWGLEHFLELTPYHAVFPPLGLLTLAGLTPPEFRVTLCDDNAGEPIDYETDADIVCITGYIIQMAQVFAIADEFRRRGKTVVIGGPMANLLPKECRDHCDVLFEGEAEYTWPQFLRDYAAGRSRPTATTRRRRSTCPIRRRRASTCCDGATRTASFNARAAARSLASSATSSSCTAARCASSRSSG